jgi:hypothetical protein
LALVAVFIAIASFPLPIGASSPLKWVPASFPCPGRVVGVIDYTSRSAYIFPLQKIVKVAIPRSTQGWRKGCALMGKAKRDKAWCPTPRMQAQKPEVKCKGSFSRDKGNPTGVAFIPIDFIDDPTDRFLGFHGTNDERVLGTMITSGCTRTDNRTILAIVDGKLFQPGDFLYYQWRR